MTGGDITGSWLATGGGTAGGSGVGLTTGTLGVVDEEADGITAGDVKACGGAVATPGDVVTVGTVTGGRKLASRLASADAGADAGVCAVATDVEAETAITASPTNKEDLTRNMFIED
jgi:hypothetical protein